MARKSNPPEPHPVEKYGVDDGARTHDRWNHNPELYQLSYAHQRNNLVSMPYSRRIVLLLRNPAQPFSACVIPALSRDPIPDESWIPGRSPE